MDLSQDARHRRQKTVEEPRRPSELSSSVHVSNGSQSRSHEFTPPPTYCPGDSPQQTRKEGDPSGFTAQRTMSSLPWELTLLPPHTLELLQRNRRQIQCKTTLDPFRNIPTAPSLTRVCTICGL